MSAPKALANSAFVISPMNDSLGAKFSDKITLPSLALMLCFNSAAVIANISDALALINLFIFKTTLSIY